MTKYFYSVARAKQYVLLTFMIVGSIALVSLSGAPVRAVIAVEPIYLGRLFASIVVAAVIYAVNIWAEHFVHDKF